MHAYGPYEQALLHVQAQRLQDASVINSSLVSAVRGHFGDYHLTRKTVGSRLWISPLMPLYWFFDFDAVARRNRLLDAIDSSYSFHEAVQRVMLQSQQIQRRTGGRVPL
jgi:hypothetical protein